MIGYPNYKLYFTAWALGRYDHVYLPMLKEMDADRDDVLSTREK
jgi:lanosterol synthase